MADTRRKDDDAREDRNWPLPEQLARRVLRIVIRKTGAESVTAAPAVRECPFMRVTEFRTRHPNREGVDILRYRAIPIILGQQCIGSLGIQFAEGNGAGRIDQVLRRLAGVLGRLALFEVGNDEP